MDIIKNEKFYRRQKLKKLKEYGFLFPNNFRRNFISNQLYDLYSNKNNEELKKLNIEIRIAGRIMRQRIMGKACFICLKDSGGFIQIYISQNNICYHEYDKLLKILDLGDIIGVLGYLFKTRTQELSILCKEIYLLTKTIRSIPNKFHGLSNQELRYRKRYLDLISNEISYKIFVLRSKIILEIRSFMFSNNFIEIETPIMQSIPGGAEARPFSTYHNALNMDMFLRISPELYLKRAIIGGFEKIFEINKSFRNEGLSSLHNPEFTMLELYIAYVDYHDLMIFLEKLLKTVYYKIYNTNILYFGKYVIDINKPFIKMTMLESINNYCQKSCNLNLHDFDDLIYLAQDLGINVENYWKIGHLQHEIFEKTVVKNLIQPTFIIDYPIEVSPLARSRDDNPLFTERFEFFMGGCEVSNGFSELNDYDDQLIRFKKQQENNNMKLFNQSFHDSTNKHKNKEFYDKEYITALEYGLPPTAGLGLGIDRIVMLFNNIENIRDVILFPMLKI